MDQIYWALAVALFVILIWIIFHFCYRSHELVDIKSHDKITNSNVHLQCCQGCQCYNCSNWIIAKTVKHNQFSLVDRWRKFDPMKIVNDTKHLVSYRKVLNYTSIDCNGVIIPNTFHDPLEPASTQMNIEGNIHVNSETTKSSQLSELDDILVVENIQCV